MKAGVGGALALIAVVLLVVLAFGAIGLLAAVQTGSAEQVQALFSVSLGLLFMSSMAMPRNLIQEDWFKTIATYNPMSYLVEATRSLFINGWDAEALALGVRHSPPSRLIAGPGRLGRGSRRRSWQSDAAPSPSRCGVAPRNLRGTS